MREKNNLWRRIILAALFLALILAGFFVYLSATRSRTLERNGNYIADATSQTAKRIGDLLISAENSIVAIANLYEENMDPFSANVELLEKMTESTVFDYIGIVDANKIYTDNRGLQADVSDRTYAQDAFRGNSGVDVVFNGRVSGEDLVIFYAPLWKDGEVVGALTGRYRQQMMREIITATYFGEPANTYLCLSDGTVIASSSETRPQNILDDLRNNENTDQEALEILTKALTEQSSTGFSYSNSNGSSVAYVTKLPNIDWMLLQVFPLVVTNEMLSESNGSATHLIIWLVAIATLYVTLLLIENSIEKKKLTREKQQMRNIVGTTSHLFRRFILLDLEKDEYTILSDDEESVSGPLDAKGSYSHLRDYWMDKVLDADKENSLNVKLSVESIQKDLTEDVPYLQYEAHVRENGTKWWQISLLSLKRKQGVTVSALMAVQDVSELKEREQRSRMALEDAYLSAEAANEAKRNFLFDMSHDMRTPLNAVIGLSGLLDRDASSPDRVRSYSRKIKASGHHLLTMVNEVLDMSKIESGRNALNMAPFSLSSLLEEATFVFMPQARDKGLTLKINAFDVPQERLIGDKLRISAILENLISNAIKFTPRGGEVTLTIQGREETSQGYVPLLFTVTDNGIGISPEFLPNVFDPFSRERNSTISGIQGSGLGLTITKSIVSLMGGTISVESVPGKGSKFEVELELRPAAVECGQAFLKENGIRRALILGTDERICRSIQSLLAGPEIETRYAVNSLSAWKEGTSGKYDLIFLDHRLPETDTIGSIREIRAHFGNDTPLILIDVDWISKEEKARSAGATGFLPAPFSMATLKVVISNCMGNRKDGESILSLKGLRVLCAEDNDINAEILMEILANEGITVDIAENGRIAVEKFQKSPLWHYDAVLMDIQMPEMNGYEATRAIRALNREDAIDVPIVAMTANSFADDVQKSLESGMNAHISKPMELDTLKSTLTCLVGGREKRNNTK